VIPCAAAPLQAFAGAKAESARCGRLGCAPRRTVRQSPALAAELRAHCFVEKKRRRPHDF